MKLVILVFTLILMASTALATPPGATPISEFGESNDIGEAAAVVVSGAFALLNIGTVAAHSPNYWFGGIGIGVGVVALALGAHYNAPYREGLFVAGVSAVGSGLVSVRYRYVLNRRAEQVRVEPTWHHGSPGLALVIDF